MIDRRSAQELTRQINSILSSISRSLEQMAFEDSLFNERIQNTYIDLQKIKFRFKSTSGRLVSPQQFEDSVSQLRGDLIEFIESSSDILFDIRVRISRYRQTAQYAFLHPAIHSASSLDAREVLFLVNESLLAALEERPFEEREVLLGDGETIEDVRRRIPEQKVAPAKFDIVNGVLKVVDQEATEKTMQQRALLKALMP